MKFNAAYIPGPGGFGPLYWRNEQSGVLAAAVQEYLVSALRQREMPEGQLNLVKEYCIYWIEAPCWVWGDGAEFKKAAGALRAATTREAFTLAMQDLLVFGVDPF